jgi:hypothetical protein
MVETIDAAEITGYAPEDRYLATRYAQGNRTVYDFELPLESIPQILPVPDPDRPTLGNRRVKPAHARDFARYVRESEDWVAPALLMRAPDHFSFETLRQLGGVSFGVLGVPRAGRRDIRIIDGQHRILGFHYAIEDIARELDEARNGQEDARRSENLDLVAHWSRRINDLDRERQRLATECLGVQIMIETDQQRYEQMFFDVADNALGITQAVKVRFDSRKVMNRTLDAVMRHALLRDRVDEEQDRITGPNPNLLGARHVVDIVRTANLGLWSRVSRRQESELQGGALVQGANEFFDILLESFPDLASVADGELAPPDLRKRSMLGASTMLRVLAGVYHDLIEQNYSEEEITDLFKRLAPWMAAPIPADSPWVRSIRSQVFDPGASAPRSRRQDLTSLNKEIAEWIDEGDRPDWLVPPQSH